jgi:hypothetical protein
MIYNIFSYSEPYELDLLEIKLNLENVGVDQWIITENDYDLQGKYKGVHFLEYKLQEERFAKFRNKIHVIEISSHGDFFAGNADNYDTIYFQRNWQEFYLTDCIQCMPDDIIIVSDLDESVNFAEHKEEILSQFIPGRLNKLKQKMFFLDFDNEAGTWEHSMMLNFGDMIGKFFPTNPQLYLTLPDSNLIHNAGYHYINCFSKEQIWRKLQTYGHVGIPRETLDSWCKYNHGGGNDIMATYQGKFHCEIIELNETNSSAFVRQNLKRFKTNSIDVNYKKNRELWKTTSA